MLAFLWKWHRRFGIIACIGFIGWGLSSLAHPLMSRLQAKPAQMQPPKQVFDLSRALPLPQLLVQQQISQLQSVSLAQFKNGKAYYRLSYQGNSHYFDLQSGQEYPDADRLYAEELARYYTGLEDAAIISARLVTHFDAEYTETNRLQPVWRIEFAHARHLRAYIDTEQARLATLVDTPKYVLGQIFQIGHNWSFLDGMPTLQCLIILFLLVLMFSSGVSGLYFYAKLHHNHARRLKNRPITHWHRHLSLLVGISCLLFSFSGGLHILMKYRRANLATNHSASISTVYPTRALDNSIWQTLSQDYPRVTGLYLIGTSTAPIWFILPQQSDLPSIQVGILAAEEHAEHAHQHSKPIQESNNAPVYRNAQTKTATTPSAYSLAAQIALQASGLPATQLEAEKTDGSNQITRFNAEYGFIFKRLPVTKISFSDANQSRFYIENNTGIIAAKGDKWDGIEGWSFSWLHKWNFFADYKNLRDILISLTAFFHLVMGILGLKLFLAHRSKH